MPPPTTQRPGCAPVAPSRRAARSDPACRCALAVARPTGSRTSQRRNRRFVVSPRTTVASSASVSRSSASSRSRPWAMILASIGSNRPPTSSPSATPASTRMPRPPASAAARCDRSPAGIRPRRPRHRAAPRRRGRRSRRPSWSKPERLPGRDPQLVRDEVAPRDELGHRDARPGAACSSRGT